MKIKIILYLMFILTLSSCAAKKDKTDKTAIMDSIDTIASVDTIDDVVSDIPTIESKSKVVPVPKPKLSLCDNKKGYEINLSEESFVNAFTFTQVVEEDGAYKMTMDIKVSELTHANGFVSNHAWVQTETSGTHDQFISSDNEDSFKRGSFLIGSAANTNIKLLKAYNQLSGLGVPATSYREALNPENDLYEGLKGQAMHESGTDSSANDVDIQFSLRGKDRIAGNPSVGGWQEIFSIQPCDKTAKNGFIAAQLIKEDSGKTTTIANSMTEPTKFNHSSNEKGTNTINIFKLDGTKSHFDSHIGSDFVNDGALGLFTIQHKIYEARKIEAADNAQITRGAVVCRSIVNNSSVTEDSVMKCYLGLTALYPTILHEALQSIHNDQFENKYEFGQYDLRSKEVGLIIVDTGSLKSNNPVINKVLTDTDYFNTFFKDEKAMKTLLETEEVKHTFGKIKLNFTR